MTNYICKFFSLLIIISCIVSCVKSYDHIELLEKFYNTEIQIKENDFVVEDYCMFPDTAQSKYNIIHVYDFSDCVDCASNALYVAEQMNVKKDQYKICNIFIILSRKHLLNQLQRDLYVKRIKSKVYIDTCNAFLSANPQIPDNELFHTFVINNEGKVLMVGNPFQNEKMEALFKKVIANERKKQKAKKSA